MDQLSPQVLNDLLNSPADMRISLYMPTYKTSPDSLQNPIRFQNLIKNAFRQLQSAGLTQHQIAASLDQTAAKLEDDDFWMHQKTGLAVFISSHHQLFFTLPLDFPELVVVNRYFHLKPLLPLITANGKFYILTLSQKDVKLYQATRTSIDKLFLGDMPRCLDEAVYVEDLEKSGQFHAHASANKTKGNGSSYARQGGSGEERYKQLIDRFITQLENGITSLLAGQKAPLILYGVEYLTAIYQKVNKYNFVLNQTIAGNPEDVNKQVIHQKAWAIVHDYFKTEERAALDEYFNKAGKNTANYLQEILPNAYGGRVKTLFVLRDHSIWGNFQLDTNTVTITGQNNPSTDDLMNLATIYTLLGDGKVYSMKKNEMIPNTPIAAVYRY